MSELIGKLKCWAGEHEPDMPLSYFEGGETCVRCGRVRIGGLADPHAFPPQRQWALPVGDYQWLARQVRSAARQGHLARANQDFIGYTLVPKP